MMRTYYYQDNFHEDRVIPIEFHDVDHIAKKPDGSARVYTEDGRVHYVRRGWVKHEDSEE